MQVSVLRPDKKRNYHAYVFRIAVWYTKYRNLYAEVNCFLSPLDWWLKLNGDYDTEGVSATRNKYRDQGRVVRITMLLVN